MKNTSFITMTTSTLNANDVKEKANKGSPNVDKNKKEESRLIKKTEKGIKRF